MFQRPSKVMCICALEDSAFGQRLSAVSSNTISGLIIFLSLDAVRHRGHSYIEKNSSYVEEGKFQPDRYQAA